VQPREDMVQPREDMVELRNFGPQPGLFGEPFGEHFGHLDELLCNFLATGFFLHLPGGTLSEKVLKKRGTRHLEMCVLYSE